MGNPALQQGQYFVIITLVVVILSKITEQALAQEQFQITNGIGRWPAVYYRCQTGDEDLGYKYLNPSQSVVFKYENTWWLNNVLYFCHFYYNGKDKVFDVYKEADDEIECFYDSYCYQGYMEWVIKDDGFYLRCNFSYIQGCDLYKTPPQPTPLIKKHGWS
ncbi:hypothetical protein RND81_03G057500 [Saponaria officinalis]|uniref:S-protein homolog n=1 Tax=Saponaria officinalis TaxID=3572 RepID=A0AAW1M1H8_SAPOF